MNVRTCMCAAGGENEAVQQAAGTAVGGLGRCWEGERELAYVEGGEREGQGACPGALHARCAG